MSVHLFPVQPPPVETDSDTIEKLEWLLSEAKEGRVIGIAWVNLQPGGEVGMGWTQGCTYNRLSVIGGVSCLEAMMHRTLVEL